MFINFSLIAKNIVYILEIIKDEYSESFGFCNRVRLALLHYLTKQIVHPA
jgi:hypothetical protein